MKLIIYKGQVNPIRLFHHISHNAARMLNYWPKKEQTIEEMRARSKALSGSPVPAPTIPYLEISVKTKDREEVWKNFNLTPSESMTVGNGDHWLYKAVGNKTAHRTVSKVSSRTPSPTELQTALLSAAWKTEATYRKDTSPEPTLKVPKPENQSSGSTYGSKPLSDCWRLPDETMSQHLVYRLHTGAPYPTILSPSFAVIADSEGVATSQIKGRDPITHYASIASSSGGRTAGTQVPAITVTEHVN